jgi:PAS domain-containing protein
VCEHCGLGLVLKAPASVAPSARDAFVVVDRSARVCALSGVAETLLAVAEREAVGRPIIELIAPVTDRTDDGRAMVALLRAVARGTQDAGRARCLVAGAAVTIRVGPCGPPRAALLVLELDPAR